MASVDLGAIVRQAGPSYLATHRTTAAQRKVLTALAACRTSVLGGELRRCDRCGFEHMQWHSCRNRHCPRCQASARLAWLDARKAELLPVPYFHVVFTLPEDLNPIGLHAPRVFYDALFRSVGQTLIDVGRSKLRADLGALCVLHTWGQTLVFHPHIHCVVPGGGFTADGSQWRTVPSPSFFLPVKVLSRRFRTLFCEALRQAWIAGALNLPESVAADRAGFDLMLARACRQDWVVYAKPPFAGPPQVLAYLASYTHRIAISNRRIEAFDGEHVTFRYRDYAHHNRPRTMILKVHEFLRRFLLHVVPRRFVRIRYYGFLANRVRAERLARARTLLTTNPLSDADSGNATAAESAISDLDAVPTTVSPPCPHCHEGVLLLIARIDPAGFDSS